MLPSARASGLLRVTSADLARCQSLPSSPALRTSRYIARSEAMGQTRLVNGRPTVVVENTKEFAAATEAAWKRTAPLIDSKVKQLRGCMTVLAERVATALEEAKRKTPEGLSHASELRAYVKALPEEKRSAFIFQAISDGDRATVASVLHAQPFLSGLSAKAQGMLRQHAAAKFAPQDHAQHQAAATARESMSWTQVPSSVCAMVPCRAA